MCYLSESKLVSTFDLIKQFDSNCQFGALKNLTMILAPSGDNWVCRKIICFTSCDSQQQQSDKIPCAQHVVASTTTSFCQSTVKGHIFSVIGQSDMSEKKDNATLPTKVNSSLLLPNGGNATGSGRNKVALRPGFSLMGWVRHSSTSSVDDLTGISGPRIVVTMDELKKHDQPDDCWMAIRGKVYNVTSYIDYHPGGVEELMRGAGTNATELFDETHSYVNYETLLQKCYVGRLAGHDLWPFAIRIPHPNLSFLFAVFK